jgi:undecaprenyl phosphate-alpha-L-ara4FN deformylase
MRTTISVTVETISGATAGLERILALFSAYEIKASFFVSLGPGRDSGFFRRLAASNHLLAHADMFRAVGKAGHDLGMAPWDSSAWASMAAHADREWVLGQWKRALESWQDLFSVPPASHAATDFQVNPWLFEVEQQTGLAFASDVLGKSPFLPVMQAIESHCLQLPVTLVPLSVLRASGKCPESTLHEELFAASQKILPAGQHWRITADENPALVEKMIVMWKGSSREFLPLSAVAEAAANSDIRQHTVGWDQQQDASWAAAQSLACVDLRR